MEPCPDLCDYLRLLCVQRLTPQCFSTPREMVDKSIDQRQMDGDCAAGSGVHCLQRLVTEAASQKSYETVAPTQRTRRDSNTSFSLVEAFGYTCGHRRYRKRLSAQPSRFPRSHRPPERPCQSPGDYQGISDAGALSLIWTDSNRKNQSLPPSSKSDLNSRMVL